MFLPALTCPPYPLRSTPEHHGAVNI